MIKSHVLYQLSYEPIVLRFGHTKVLLFLKLANLGRRKSGAKGARPVRATSDPTRMERRCAELRTHKKTDAHDGRPYDGTQYILWGSMRILYGRNVMRPYMRFG